MCEPGALQSCRALVLTGTGGVGVAIVPCHTSISLPLSLSPHYITLTYDVVLRKITGAFLHNILAPGGLQ